MSDGSAPPLVSLPPLKWQKSDFCDFRAERGLRTVVAPCLWGLRRAHGGNDKAHSMICWESPCSCRPTAVISAAFLWKISMSFALNLAIDRVKENIQLEGSRGRSLSLHGWALSTCDSNASVSCGPESCFLFVAPQILQLWEKNKKSFPLEWLSGRRSQRWEEHTCHSNC